MKYKLYSVITLMGLAIGSTAMAASSVTLNSEMDKVSYSVGYDIGKGLSQQSIGIEPDQFTAGFTAGINNGTPAMSEADMKSTLMSFQKQMMQQAMAKQSAKAGENLQASQTYLAKIAAEPGVKKLQDGLYYQVLTKGSGTIPGATDTVTVNYEGTLIDGTVFDSSYKRGQPATFQVNQVIPGWTKALQKMPAGSTWMVYISPELAYGDKGVPPLIGPNTALTFKINLLSVKKAS